MCRREPAAIERIFWWALNLSKQLPNAWPKQRSVKNESRMKAEWKHGNIMHVVVSRPKITASDSYVRRLNCHLFSYKKCIFEEHAWWKILELYRLKFRNNFLIQFRFKREKGLYLLQSLITSKNSFINLMEILSPAFSSVVVVRCSKETNRNTLQSKLFKRINPAITVLHQQWLQKTFNSN